jgi:hypothetical protein
LLLLLWLAAAPPATAELTAGLSRGSVAAGQTVMLTLTQTGSNPAPPDLVPIEQDFHIVGRSASSQVSVINGQRRERRELRLTLLPRRSGTLTVPSISAGSDGSAPLTLVVGAATTDTSRLLPAPAGVTQPPAVSAPELDVTVDAAISPHRARVAEQVLLTVQVTSADGPPRGRLHDPRPDWARVLPLGEDRRTEDADGTERHVYERRYALFPSESGRFAIEPLRYDAWAAGVGAPTTSRSPALAVQVKDPPARVDDRQWLPAQSLTLTEAGPSEVQLAPGQALERTITLTADGLMAEDLPAIPLAVPFQLRVRDDPPRLWNERRPDGVVGHRMERILISSAEPGRYVLKTGEVPWWNTRTGRWETATLPDWTLTVATLDSSDRRLAPTWTPKAREPEAADAAPDADRPDGERDQGVGAGPWLATLAAMLVVALLLWWRRHRRQPPAPFAADYAPKAPSGTAADESAPAPDPMAQAIAEVAAAYDTGNPNQARSALLRWAALVWPGDAPGNLARLSLRLPEPLRGRITLLEKAFFSPTPVDWISQPVVPLLEEVAARETKPRPETADQS